MRDNWYGMCLVNPSPPKKNVYIRLIYRPKWGVVTKEGEEGRGGVLDKRDVLDLMHGHSRMTIDPRIPAMPERSSTSGFYRQKADVACTKREAP